MTFSDFGWPFHASRAVSAVAELLVVVVGGNPIGTRWSNFPAFLIVPFPNFPSSVFFHRVCSPSLRPLTLKGLKTAVSCLQILGVILAKVDKKYIFNLSHYIF